MAQTEEQKLLRADVRNQRVTANNEDMAAKAARQAANRAARAARNQPAPAAPPPPDVPQPTTPATNFQINVPEVNPSEGSFVENRLTGLLGKDSPYMQMARSQGLQTANRRGLINSSIAAGASENEAIKAALPIATADAATESQFGLQRGQQQFQTALSSQEFGQNRENQIRELESRFGISRLEAENRLKLQAAADRAAAQRQTQAEKAALAQQTQSEASALTRQTQSEAASFDTQRYLAGENARANALSTLNSAVTDANAIIAAARQNKEISPATRDVIIQEQTARIQNMQQAVNTVYGFDIQYTNTGAGTSTGTGDAGTGPGTGVGTGTNGTAGGGTQRLPSTLPAPLGGAAIPTRDVR